MAKDGVRATTAAPSKNPTVTRRWILALLVNGRAFWAFSRMNVDDRGDCVLDILERQEMARSCRQYLLG